MRINRLKKVRREDFAAEVLRASAPVVVLFEASDCVPCKALKPTIQKVRRRFRGEVRFVSVHLDQAPGLARGFGIVALPTLGLFYDGAMQDTLRIPNGAARAASTV
jgi:thioredoxin-like negative regulator of GroEL